MGVNNQRLLSGYNNPSPGDDIYYFWITDAEREQLRSIWPEFITDFSLTFPGTPGIWYANPGSISEVEAELLMDLGFHRLAGFEISNQPGHYGG